METGPGAATRRPDGSYGSPQGYYIQEAIEGGRKTWQPGPNPFENAPGEQIDYGEQLGPKMQVNPASFKASGRAGPPQGPPGFPPGFPGQQPPNQQPRDQPDTIVIPPGARGHMGHGAGQHNPRPLPMKKAPFAGPPPLKDVVPFWSGQNGPTRYEWLAWQDLTGQGYSQQEAAGLIRNGSRAGSSPLPITGPIHDATRQYPAFNKDANGNWIENRGLRPGPLPPSYQR